MQMLRPSSSKVVTAFLIAASLTLCMLVALANTSQAEATTGTCYTATLERNYKHPVTGKIEDSAGSSSYATGQAMVESAVASTGLMEVTDSGAVYLTMRMSLIDHIKSFDFKAQKRGASGWSSTKGEVSKKGSDKSGTTNDVRVKIPSKDSIVRVKMYVTSMGRDVIYFVSISDFSEGAPSGFKALIVTKNSSESAVSAEGKSSKANSRSSSKKNTGKDSSAKESNKASKASDNSSEDGSQEKESKSSADELNSESASNAQGLSLSTTPESSQTQSSEQEAGESASKQSAPATSVDMTQLIALIALSSLGVGLLLIAAAAVVVWQFHLRWNSWSANDSDDYSAAYRRQHHGE